MMTVYYNESQYHKLNWQVVFLEMALHLREKYGANIVHHQGYDHQHTVLHVKELNCNLADCDFLVYRSEDDTMMGLTFADNPGEFVDAFIRRNKPQDKIIIMQFCNRWPRNFDTSVYNFQILQGTNYTHSPITNYEYYYHERLFRKDKEYIDKMFFLGRDDRTSVFDLRRLGVCGENVNTITHINYMAEMMKYKMGLALPGVGEICAREIEYLAVGIPMIKFEYITQLNPPLIPNFHYIAVERDKNNIPWDCHLDQRGSPEHSEAIRQRFYEVKDDKELLNFVAKNGREYYFKYSHPVNRLNHIINILEL